MSSGEWVLERETELEQLAGVMRDYCARAFESGDWNDLDQLDIHAERFRLAETYFGGDLVKATHACAEALTLACKVETRQTNDRLDGEQHD